MSSPVHHPEDLDAALRYAPPWARNTNTPGDPAAAIPPIIPSDDDFEPSFDGDRAMLDLQHRLSLDPDEPPEPPVRIDDRPTLDRIALRLCAVAGLAALVAWLTISLPINMSLPFKPHIDEIVRAAVAPAMTATPIKVVHIHTPIAPLALVSTQPVAPAAVPARLAEATPRATRARQEPPEGAPAADPPRPPAKTVALAPDEISMLVKRGKDLLTTGDVASARLLLRRAAEAGDAEAALAFGSTFDPAVIARLGAIGVETDSARARKWYEKAAALGSNLASDKIAKLAEAGR